MNKTTLDLLLPNESCTVVGINHNSEMNRRLGDLGLIEGTRVDCLYRSPCGSPAAYLVRGAVIAIRRGDAGRVAVEKSL